MSVRMNTRMLPVSFYYALIFMSAGAFSSYVGLYYSHIQLSGIQIGILTSVSAVIALFGQPFWGLVSDRSRLKNRVLAFCLLASAAGIWLIPLAGAYFGLLVLALGIFSFFQTAVNPLSDAITLELASRHGISFSRIRTVGSLGYALMSAVAGWIFQYQIQSMFVLFSGLMLAALSLSFWVPPVEGHQSGKQKVRLFVLFKNPRLVCLYAYSFIIQMTMGFFFAFQAIYSEQKGISTSLIGLGLMIGSFSQFPFMIFFDRIYRKFGMIPILLFSGIIHAIRWALCAAWLNSHTILILWILHGGTYILFYLCLATYVNEEAIKELKASGQMMNSVITSGVSRIAGGIVGGIYVSNFGYASAFWTSAAVCAAASAGLYGVWQGTTLFGTGSVSAKGISRESGQ